MITDSSSSTMKLYLYDDCLDWYRSIPYTENIFATKSKIPNDIYKVEHPPPYTTTTIKISIEFLE
ncbi:hypothetical protein DERP_001168 [Dermatophagoides pteronyssinus]|uniref:Uncharacterized protein n=1 Tax=Dermatophagoides pteronyssinus TaxID=6956 RepID=A0ABQ8JE77_DERPT|nr:hypothetical protein DERP_001168 [Dermatophagoides pteronyssinus]